MGKDLFEMLQLRQRGTSAPRARPRKTEGGQRGASEVLGRLWSWFEPVRAAWPRRTGRARTGRRVAARQSRAPLAVSGVWVAVLVIGGLGIGFAVGRGTAGETRSEQLSTSGPVGPRTPGVLPEPGGTARGPVGLDTAREEETLSDSFFWLLHFAAHDRVRASNLASHLRDHGLETARIGRAKLHGQAGWSVFVYVPAVQDGPACLEKLRAVPAPTWEPEFAPGLADCIARGLTQRQHKS